MCAVLKSPPLVTTTAGRLDPVPLRTPRPQLSVQNAKGEGGGNGGLWGWWGEVKHP